jgi:hypothetical protein
MSEQELRRRQAENHALQVLRTHHTDFFHFLIDGFQREFAKQISEHQPPVRAPNEGLFGGLLRREKEVTEQARERAVRAAENLFLNHNQRFLEFKRDFENSN